MPGIAEPVIEAGWIDKGYEQITTLTTAVGLTVPDGASIALIRPETQAVRYRADGTNPQAGVGMTLAVDVTVEFRGRALLEALKFIEAVVGATLNVHYFTG